MGKHGKLLQEVMPCIHEPFLCHAGDDDTVTFSFGALVDKIKNNLSPQAFRSNGSRSRVGSSAGLATRPGAAQLPRGSLSTAGKGSSIQRSRSRMQAVPKGESHLQDSNYSMAVSMQRAWDIACMSMRSRVLAAELLNYHSCHAIFGCRVILCRCR